MDAPQEKPSALDKVRQAFAVAVGLAVIGLILGGLVVFVRAIANLRPETRTPVLAAMTTVFVSVITILLTRYFERRSQREKAQQEKRIPVYEDFVKDFLRLIGATKAPSQRGSGPTEEETFEVLGRFTERLIVWGSDDVIRAWVDFRARYQDGVAPQGLEGLELWDRLLLGIRADLGLSNAKLRPLDLVRLWVNDLPPDAGQRR